MNGGLEVRIWNVEHGSAAFLQTPHGRTVAFDAGRSDDFSPAEHLKSNYEAFRDPHSRRDQLFVSHPDQDHINDLPRDCELLQPRIVTRNRTIPADCIYSNGDPSKATPVVQVGHGHAGHSSFGNHRFHGCRFISPLVLQPLNGAALGVKPAPAPLPSWPLRRGPPRPGAACRRRPQRRSEPSQA